jgi:Family of unknown function (DUF6011)
MRRRRATELDRDIEEEQMKALDVLREKATEIAAMTANSGTRTRRPSFAPALLLGDDLVKMLRELEWLGAEDKTVARLWSTFTTPRRGPVRCEGFRLRAGQEHNGKTMWWAQYFDKESVLANIQRQIETTNDPGYIKYLYNALDVTEQRRGGWSFGPHWTSYIWRGVDLLPVVKKVEELSQTRVMEFAGAPAEQMRAAGRYCGHCAICGKALTEPKSLELGIGPECRRKFALLHGLTSETVVRNAPGAWVIDGKDAPAGEINV